ncbi:MAG: DUF3303 family protein [Dehalococcoidia bacterium]
MKYVILADLDPETGIEIEAQPEKIQELIGKWQAHNLLGFYFSITSRRLTIIIEADNEDEFFDALHATWVLTLDYPDVYPVVDVDDFPDLLARAGVS